MDKSEIIRAILSRDSDKLAEAKTAIRAILDTRATQFRSDSSKFIAKSLFESEELPKGFPLVKDHVDDSEQSGSAEEPEDDPTSLLLDLPKPKSEEPPEEKTEE
jgi:hypothetical protein